MVGRALFIACLCLVASVANAQSKRYPPQPVDKDRETEQRSDLWNEASQPQKRPYEKLVAVSKALIDERTDDKAKDAVERLTQAIALSPAEATAYAMRATANMQLREWAKCADDLQAARDRATPDDSDNKPAQQEQQRRLGLCLARAGRLAEAERVLSDAALSGAASGEMMMRLGEVRMAQGKLEEAIAALVVSVDAPDMPQPALGWWLLSAAYDRSRRSSEAIAAARSGAAYDRDFVQLRSPLLPLLGVGETEYLLGIAYEYGHEETVPARPERALVMFRRFATLAPDSPWRRRAEEHVKELKTTQFPESVEYRGGTAQFDLPAARATVRKALPQLGKCMAKTPGVVYTVSVTRTGPVAAMPKPVVVTPVRPGYYRPYVPRPILPPPEGVQFEAWNESDPTPRADKDAAMRCMDPLVTKLAFPKIKEANAWVQFQFSLVTP
ncbi:MAG TPA: hypothetical protein VGM90_36420 [Kofleriaceae bacterium]